MRHASSAYLASLAQTRDLCAAIDANFDPTDRDGGLHAAEVEADLRRNLLDAAPPDRGDVLLSQKKISTMLDAAALHQLQRDECGDSPFLAHVALTSLPGAGAWLTAPPAEDGREIDAELFKIALKRRLRVPIYSADDFCPLCGDILGRWGDHAVTC